MEPGLSSPHQAKKRVSTLPTRVRGDCLASFGAEFNTKANG